MTTLASYFLQALKNVEPDDDATNAKAAHAEVRKVLKESDALKALGIDPILIGSYARSVSIKRVKAECLPLVVGCVCTRHQTRDKPTTGGWSPRPCLGRL